MGFLILLFNTVFKQHNTLVSFGNMVILFMENKVLATKKGSKISGMFVTEVSDLPVFGREALLSVRHKYILS